MTAMKIEKASKNSPHDLVNPVIMRLLGSRLHFLFGGGTMILTVTGRKSGKRYDVPLTHVPGFEELISTPCGRALIMKLGLVSVMLPIGFINLIDSGRDPFSSMVVMELILAFGVFATTGSLTSLPPP